MRVVSIRPASESNHPEEQEEEEEEDDGHREDDTCGLLTTCFLWPSGIRESRSTFIGDHSFSASVGSSLCRGALKR